MNEWRDGWMDKWMHETLDTVVLSGSGHISHFKTGLILLLANT